MLLYSNDACENVTSKTSIIRCESIVSYEILSRLGGFEIYVYLVNDEVVRLITKSSYEEAIAVVEKSSVKYQDQNQFKL